MQTLSPVIRPKELIQLRSKPGLVLIDARAGANAKKSYVENHLEGAIFVDVDAELADIKPDVSAGGRHPLPTPAQFSTVLSRLGITPSSHIVVYDDKNGANAAARFWWMMRAVGHAKVQVLDGGFDAALKAGLPAATGEVAVKPSAPYLFSKWLLPIADMDEVDRVRRDEGYLVIDVRDEIRFDGIHEPIDLVAGHIPGAINVPLTDNLDLSGFFLSAPILREKYEQILEGRPANQVIVHCGSGVSACHTLLAMDLAGLEIPKLYVGSWSEWSRNDKPIGRIQQNKRA